MDNGHNQSLQPYLIDTAYENNLATVASVSFSHRNVRMCCFALFCYCGTSNIFSCVHFKKTSYLKRSISFFVLVPGVNWTLRPKNGGQHSVKKNLSTLRINMNLVKLLSFNFLPGFLLMFLTTSPCSWKY